MADELKRENPATEDIQAVIVFADIIKSSGVAISRDLASYHSLINEFQETMHLIITHHLESYHYSPLKIGEESAENEEVGKNYEWTIEGDEARIILYSGDENYDMRSAVLLAIKLKLGFLTTDLNQSNLDEGRPAYDIALGLHLGRILRSVKPWHRKRGDAVPRVKGIAIAKAQKVMQEARLGYFSKIAASHDFQTGLRNLTSFPCHFFENTQMRLDVHGEAETLYELVGYFDHEVYWHLPPSRRKMILERAVAIGEKFFARRQFLWLSLLLLRYYFDKGALDFRKEQDLSKIVEFGSAVIKEYGSETAGHLRQFICTVHNAIGIAYEIMAENTGIELYQEKAQQEFDLVLSISPENAAANYHLGNMLETKGDYAGALRHIQTILVRDPYNSDAQAAEKRLKALLK